jgi:S1-C subfamily serine protease
MKDPFAKPDALRIKPLEVEGWPASIDLVRGRLTLGRAPENDVALPGATFPAVSGRHARIEARDGRLWVVDLDSKNGTLVNGERVTERALGPGDILRLGAVGPKFMVTGRKALEQTVFVDQKALGIAPEVSKQEVEALVARGTKRSSRRVLVLGVALVASIVLRLSTGREGETRDEAAHVAELAAAREDFASELADVGEALEERLAREWANLERERPAASAAASTGNTAGNTVVASIGATADDVDELRRQLDATRAELGTAREQLDDALAKFDRLDPASVARARLGGVAAVRRAVVLIESRLVLRNQSSGALLHEERSAFGVRPNFDGQGEVFALESTGSGFCVAADGSIVTNVHVVSVPEDHEVLRATRGLPIEPVLELAAVFSGETQRHPLTVVRRAQDGLDLALARITPFEGMPHLAELDLTVQPPPPGSDIYLIGFPLGHYALQEGERVIASTFRGILSRYVGGRMQVDAGVHPGNSGGPITDSAGRVVGVVFSVQALPDHTAVYTIGYGIPVAELARVWAPTPARATPALGEEPVPGNTR